MNTTKYKLHCNECGGLAKLHSTRLSTYNGVVVKQRYTVCVECGKKAYALYDAKTNELIMRGNVRRLKGK